MLAAAGLSLPWLTCRGSANAAARMPRLLLAPSPALAYSAAQSARPASRVAAAGLPARARLTRTPFWDARRGRAPAVGLRGLEHAQQARRSARMPLAPNSPTCARTKPKPEPKIQQEK